MNRYGSIIHRLGGFLRALGADRRGSIAWLLAAAAIPLVAAIGLSVDGARGWLLKSRLSQAIDAAGLAGGRVISSPSRDNDIHMFFTANFPPGFMDAQVDGPNISVDAQSKTITINAGATIQTTFMRVVGINTMTVHANTVVKRTDRGMELVLVMDNTGSMHERVGSVAKIVAMQNAAKALVNSLYGSRETVPTLWVGLVPYAAIVNIGTTNSAWTVPRSTPSVQITAAAVANSDAQDSSATATVCMTTNGHPFWDGAIVDISGVDSDPRYNGRHLIRTVNSQSTDRDQTDCSITSSQRTKKFWYVIEGRKTSTSGGLPDPSGANMRALLPPSDYSQSVNKNGQPVGWAGCVEARVGNNYEEEQAETLPDSAGTKWVQAFWPSTHGMKFFNALKRKLPAFTPSPNDGGNPLAHFPNVSTPTSFNNARDGDNDWGNGLPGTLGKVDERAWDYFAYGPNFGCPTPITPLQQSKQTVLNAIDAMAPTGRSGTMANVGLAWGWRVISENWTNKWGGATPNHPVRYDEPLISKVVILLTDGENLWADTASVPPGRANFSNAGDSDSGLPQDGDYTTYGRLSERRLGAGITDSSAAKTEINNRMLRLCNAMKAKGILIYTIVLQENDDETQNLYRSCATQPNKPYAFFSPTSDELTAIFNEIADQLANLRLAQ